MRNAAGQLTDRFHLLRLVQALLDFVTVGHVHDHAAHRAEAAVFIGISAASQHDPAHGLVLGALDPAPQLQQARRSGSFKGTFDLRHVRRDKMPEKRFAREFWKQLVITVNSVVLFTALNCAALQVYLPFRHLSRLQGVGKIVARLLQFKAAALGLRRHAESAIQQAFEFARIDSHNDEACSQGVEPAGKPPHASADGTRKRDDAIEQEQRQRNSQPKLEHGAQPRSDAQQKQNQRNKYRDGRAYFGIGEQAIIVFLAELWQHATCSLSNQVMVRTLRIASATMILAMRPALSGLTAGVSPSPAK